jgi:hypothetical protein
MIIRVKILLTTIIFLFSCSIIKNKSRIEANKFSYLIKTNNHSLLANLKYDSLKNVSIKLFDQSGLKVLETSINHDSFEIKYILDDSYRSDVFENFKKINKEINFYQLIYEYNFGFNLKNPVPKFYDIEIINSGGCIVLNQESKNYLLKICSEKWQFRDSIIYFNNSDIYVNDKIEIVLKKIND